MLNIKIDELEKVLNEIKRKQQVNLKIIQDESIRCITSQTSLHKIQNLEKQTSHDLQK